MASSFWVWSYSLRLETSIYLTSYEVSFLPLLQHMGPFGMAGTDCIIEASDLSLARKMRVFCPTYEYPQWIYMEGNCLARLDMPFPME